MIQYITVPGTWGYDGDDNKEWWYPGSLFSQYLGKLGFDQRLVCEEPYVWSSNVDGADWMRYFGKRPSHRDWTSAAKAFKYYIHDIPYEDRNIIAHSHGGQVVAYAALDTPIRNLITVGTPVRSDMENVYKAARPSIGYWAHVYSAKSDFYQVFGELFDGRLGIFRKMPQADVNINIPSVGHSKILKDPTQFNHWDSLAGYLELDK
jgi:pimeloyl-ACP methyl ester carboxylesterase